MRNRTTKEGFEKRYFTIGDVMNQTGVSRYLARRVVFHYRLIGRLRRRGKAWQIHLSKRQMMKVLKIMKVYGENKNKLSIDELFQKLANKEITLD